MKIYVLFFMVLFLCSCSSNEQKSKTEKITSKWPSVKLDTLPIIDIAAIDSIGSVKPDSNFVKYNDSITIRHKKVKIFSKTFYLVEGDLLMTEKQYSKYKLSIYIKKRERRLRTKEMQAMIDESERNALRINVNPINNKPITWPLGDEITFCFNKKTFNTESNYQHTKDNILAAARDWMQTCNVTFKYMPEYDNADLLYGNDKIDFVVLEYDAGGAFIAKAFFPNDSLEDRNVIVDPSYYNTPFNHTGVLRHELGHILGWRHEHISSLAPSACPDELITGTLALTKYDPKSVMHYFCGGVGTKELSISPKDKAGAQDVYGMPK